MPDAVYRVSSMPTYGGIELSGILRRNSQSMTFNLAPLYGWVNRIFRKPYVLVRSDDTVQYAPAPVSGKQFVQELIRTFDTDLSLRLGENGVVYPESRFSERALLFPEVRLSLAPLHSLSCLRKHSDGLGRGAARYDCKQADMKVECVVQEHATSDRPAEACGLVVRLYFDYRGEARVFGTFLRAQTAELASAYGLKLQK